MTTATPLTDLRVVEVGGGRAASYCTKLLADAGADVVKVEPPGGDPLRRWAACGVEVPPGEDGAYFRFLNTSKRSVVLDLPAEAARLGELAGWADVVVDSLGPGGLDRAGAPFAALQERNPALVVVSLSPFGASGPWAERTATEFTLQAWCGSTGFRGTPDRPPVSVGGRVGELMTAGYAASAALLAHRRARRDGAGDHVDVSMLECMTSTMQIYEWLHASLMLLEGFSRSIEIPSVEPVADGHIGITAMTGQQWQDFAALVEQPKLAEDPDLCHMLGRWPRREEVYGLIRPWLAERTVEELEELGALLRIPMTRLGDGSNLRHLDHFVERGVFVDNPDGFAQPRVPWSIAGAEPRPFTAAPAAGEHTEEALAEAGARPRPQPSAVPAAGAPDLPLAGVRVVELTTFMAGPLVTYLLASMGADVVKIEAAQRPDGIRFAGGQRQGVDHAWEYSWVFQGINVNKRAVTLDLSRSEGVELAKRLVATADVVVENYSPRVLDSFGLGWEDLLAVNPRLVMLRMPGFGLDGPWRDRIGFAQTMEMLSGMASVTGFPDGPPVVPRGPGDPLSGLHAAFAVLSALELAERTGEPQLVEVAMIEAALNATAKQHVEYAAYGELVRREGNHGPAGAPQNVYACAGEEQWLALAVADDAQWAALVEVAGRPSWAEDPRFATFAGRRAAHDDLDRHLGAWLAAQRLDDVVERLARAGVPAAPVVLPPDVVRNPQLVARGFFEEMHHPVTGPNLYSGLPMRLSRGPARWNRTTTPTLGEHNDEVLGGELGLTADELAALRAADVVAETLRMGT